MAGGKAKLMIELLGLKFIEDSEAMVYVQVRFPRTRRKRIRMKWANNPNNYAIRPTIMKLYNPFTGVLQYIGHPIMIVKLKQQLVNTQK